MDSTLPYRLAALNASIAEDQAPPLSTQEAELRSKITIPAKSQMMNLPIRLAQPKTPCVGMQHKTVLLATAKVRGLRIYF